MNFYSYIQQNSLLIIEFVFFFVMSLIFFLIIIFFSSKKIKYVKTNNNIQNIHTGNISRLGGAIIIIIFFVLALYNLIYKDNTNLINILFFGLPFIFIIILEDIFQNIPPSFRFLVLFISSMIVCSFGFESLPIIEIPLIETFINYRPISIIFYTLCLTAYINGVNFIDGTNGLSALTVLTSLFCLLFLTLTLLDLENANSIFYIIAILMGFIFVNYPFGKVFLGDSGAYFIGWIAGIFTIKVMVDNPSLPNWCAVSILSYPIIEVLFSFFRKIKNKKNPFYPDREHLHLKIFFTLKSKIINDLYANSLVTPFLSLIWLMPLVTIPWIYTSKLLVLLAVFIQVIIYYFFYILTPVPIKDE